MIVNQVHHDDAWHRVDVLVFGILLLTLMLYQVQHLISEFSSFHVREILCIFLYIRIIFFYRIQMTGLLRAILIFGALIFIVGLHTYYVYGFDMAMRGLVRFVHLMLIAPLAAVILSNDDDFMSMVYLWMTVVLVGILSVVYQMLGGEMPWLTQEYVAIRGDLIRHKSLLGEPNIGGIAAIFLYLLASMINGNAVIRIILLFASTFMVVVCISKAAIINFLIANLIIIAIDYRNAHKCSFIFPSRRLRTQGLAVLVWLLLLACYPLLYEYMKIGFNSVIGSQLAVPGAIEDFGDRFLFFKYGCCLNFSDWNALLFGQSFGKAGSAALEMQIPNAVGPHNMYLEIFLVGGLVLVVAFIVLLLLVIKMLYSYTASDGNRSFQWLLPIYLLICLYMMGFPNIYEPITGTLFWLIAGFACNFYRVQRPPNFI